MNVSRLSLAAVAGAAVLSSSLALATPLTDVVFGNLGSSGTNSLGATSTQIGPGAGSEVWVAQGFVTGTADNRNLSSIALGLATLSDSISTTVSVYTNNAGSPGTLLATSGAVTVSGTLQSTYVFPFSSGSFAPNQTYWVVPSAGVSWFYGTNIPTGAATPIGQNGSGYTAAGTIESDTSDIVPGAWGQAGSNRYSISVQAVPEPSTYALAGIGLATAGLVRWRKRRASGRSN